MEGKQKKNGCGSIFGIAVLGLLIYFAIGWVGSLIGSHRNAAANATARATLRTAVTAKATYRRLSATAAATMAPLTAMPPATPTPAPTAADPAFVRTDRDWNAVMTLPGRYEIDRYNRIATERAPYLSGWLSTGGTQFYSYSVEFKADFLPNATYCCPANFDLDYSYLNKRYRNVHTEYSGVAGYAGLQRQLDGSTNGILSFWDVFYTDGSGRQQTLRARLVYPQENGNSSFGGEGTGAHYLAPYEWSAGRWYELLLQCGVSQNTGNTILEEWVRDVQTGEYTLLCQYDLGVPDVCFKGDVAVFLEDFYPETAGEVRTMEVRNARICTVKGSWVTLTKGQFAQNYDYPGSYRFGASDDTFYMITTGVKGLAGTPQKSAQLTVSSGR